MSVMLDRTERRALGFRDESESAWKSIKKESDRALAAMEAQDTVAMGIFAMETVFRHTENWHAWVSEDSDRYKETDHRKLKWIESMCVQAAKTTVLLIEKTKEWGHTIEGEARFRELADRLFGAAESPEKQFSNDDFRAYTEKAYLEYQAGNAESIESWGD